MNSVQISGEPSQPPPVPATRLALLGRFAAQRRRSVLIAFAAVVLVAGGFGVQLFAALQSQGFSDPGSESARALTLLEHRFGIADPAVVLAVEPSATAPATGAAQATALVGRLTRTPGVARVVSYWTSGHPAALLGADGRTGEVLVYSAPTASAATQADLARTVTARFGGHRGGLLVTVGGVARVGNAINDAITTDLATAESIAIPISIVLLVFVFGSIVSAGLPFVVALGAILGSFATVWAISTVTSVSVFALNLITGLGLGLGIDYALLIVNRYREELDRGRSVEDAVAATVTSAGRTVVVSAGSVTVVLGSLLFFPEYFLRSFAYGGMTVTLFAALSALTALPALLALLGPKVDRLKVRRGSLAPADRGAWATVARAVMHRPLPTLVVVVAILAVIAAPAFSVHFGQVDARALPAGDPAAQATRLIDAEFPGRSSTPIDLVLTDGAGRPAAVARYAARLSLLPSVLDVTTPSSVYSRGRAVAPNPDPGSFRSAAAVRLSLIADVAPASDAGKRLVSTIRAQPSPGPRLVGGTAAWFADYVDSIASRAPLALAWVAGATVILLFLFTGSVFLPLKAVALNIVSLGATLGAIVWIFQSGHLSWLVGSFTRTGTIDTSMAVLIAVVAFALSMDYEVFLLSRIKEEHDNGLDTTAAVAFGLQRSGRIVTAAAVLLAIVFASFVSSGVTNIKQLGFGVAFAILLDATVVRGLLVPAVMRLAGRLNWWAPAPLARLHRRLGLSDA